MNLFDLRIRYKLLIIAAFLALCLPFILVGVAQALESDKIDSAGSSLKSLAYRAPLARSKQPAPGTIYDQYQQKVHQDLKFKADTKLARDKVVRQERLKNLTWRDNPKKCNQSTHWIAAERPYYCIRKQRATNTRKPVKLPSTSVRAYSSAGNTYSAGYCTYGIKMWLPKVPNMLGNANAWDESARTLGFTVSPVPKVGSVGQSDAGWGGHVVLVLKVSGNQVYIKGMNESGLWSIKYRWAPITDFEYIYF